MVAHSKTSQGLFTSAAATHVITLTNFTKQKTTTTRSPRQVGHTFSVKMIFEKPRRQSKADRPEMALMFDVSCFLMLAPLPYDATFAK
jgi:hypothetical protein